MINNQLPILRFPNYQDQWINKIIFNIAEKITDGTHDTPTQTKEGQPFLTAIHVKDGVIDYKNCYYLSIEEHNKIYKRCNPQKDDLLMVNIGAGTANCAIVDVDYEFSLKNVALIKPNKKLINAVFFSQIQRRNSKRLHHQISTGGAQPFMSLKQISNLKLIIPSDISEQQKIATFLTAVDEKINLLQKKKKGLEQYKKGVMQQLFSQKLRFKKEDGSDYPDWEEKMLGEIGKFQTSSVDKLLREGEKEVFLVNYMNVYRHENINSDTINKLNIVTAKDSQIVSNNLKKGDILFTPSSETPSDIGHSVVIFQDLKNTVYSYHLLRFRPTISIDIMYSHYFCNTTNVLKQMSRFATGSTRFTISVGNFSKVEFQMPCLEEQQKIANFLSQIDAKITIVNTQIHKMQQFKKGLLQQMFV